MFKLPQRALKNSDLMSQEWVWTYREVSLLWIWTNKASFHWGQFMNWFPSTTHTTSSSFTRGLHCSVLLIPGILLCFFSFLSTHLPVGLELLKWPLKASLAGSSSGFADDESCPPKGLLPLSLLSLICPLGLFISVIMLKSTKSKNVSRK